MAILDLQNAASTVPYLCIRVPLEGNAELNLASKSWEDELALRAWLRRTKILDDLAAVLVQLLDALDECDDDEAVLRRLLDAFDASDEEEAA